MTKSATQSISALTSSEREYIRRELDQFFGTLPAVAEGFQLRTWRGGPQKGRPKLPPPAKSLVERGLVRLDTSPTIPRLFFTETGMIALRQMMADRRLADLGCASGGCGKGTFWASLVVAALFAFSLIVSYRRVGEKTVPRSRREARKRKAGQSSSTRAAVGRRSAQAEPDPIDPAVGAVRQAGVLHRRSAMKWSEAAARSPVSGTVTPVELASI